MAVGTTYFSRAAEAVDIAGRLKPLLICVAALKSSGGFDKVGCTRVCVLKFEAFRFKSSGLSFSSPR